MACNAFFMSSFEALAAGWLPRVSDDNKGNVEWYMEALSCVSDLMGPGTQ